jgi:cell division septal protein FtsQ
MAKRKLTVRFSPIAAQIKKVAKKLKSIRARVSAADQITIDLELRDLTRCNKTLSLRCRRMNRYYTARARKV